MSDRVHDFRDVSPRIANAPEVLRALARCVTGDADCTIEEGLAASYDQTLGGDDALVGANMTYKRIETTGKGKKPKSGR
jgi:hypothetical protein